MKRIVLLLAAACSSNGGGGSIDAPTSDAPPPFDGQPDGAVADCEPVTGTPALALEEVARGLTDPIAIEIPPGDTRFFVAEKGGRIRIIEDGEPRSAHFLNISTRVSRGSEQGLLGMAFHPGYADNGRFFVSFTDTGGDTRVWEYHVSDDRNVADTQEREIFFLEQPFGNHNGGQILFGPDGMLYIPLGDGGSGYDPDGHGQRLDTLLGAMLRIDIDVAPPEKYRVPDDNPFVGMAGRRPEIWHYGLRNPWRVSFDRQTGDLWIGDVGQDKFEEIDLAPAGSKGLNFGWGVAEGNNHCPRPPYEGVCAQPGAELPVHEYGRTIGTTVVGGYVYRGCRMPDLRGTYFFSDNGAGRIFSFRYGGSPVGQEGRTEHTALAQQTPASFGEDLDGELVFCSLSGGRCYRIVPE